VRLDMAAGDEASVDLAYLTVGDAWPLREEILLHTAVGTAASKASVAETRAAPTADVLVAKVSTAHVIGANLLDGIWAWIVAFLWLIGLIVVAIVWGTDALLAAFSGVIPVTIAIFTQTRHQFTSMLRDANFQLYRTRTGIRV